MIKRESAVSPVIGVMLMLVVCLIIAAVFSGFAGSLVGNGQTDAPSLAMDVSVINTGSWIGSGFFASVTGVSEPISTNDIKLITSWTNSTGGSGGNVSIGSSGNNTYCWLGQKTKARIGSKSPLGFGPGVKGDSAGTNAIKAAAQQFGNYSLTTGTSMMAIPYGTASGAAIGGSPKSSDTNGYGVTTAYTYTYGGNCIETDFDAAEAVLGTYWESLMAGDSVKVSVVHVPSGKTIFERSVTVKEA